MKPTHSPSEDRWQDLVQRARSDAPPPVDTSALLRAVRAAADEPQAGWLAEFALLFGRRGAMAGCLAGAAAFALVATWQAWDLWQALPWAQMVATTTGGVP